MTEIKAITDATYSAETQKGLVLVDFWAQWCGPCRMQSAILEKLAAKVEGVRFCKINSDENPAVSMALTVSTLPTLMVYRNGELVDRIAGLLSEAQLHSLIERHM